MSQWPEPDFYVGQHDHLHALGVIVATFNLLEFSFFTIFNHYLGTSGDSGLRLFSSLANHKRLDIVRIEVAGREREPAVQDAVTHFISGYAILEDSRNHLVHSHAIMNLPDQPHLTFGKGSRSNPTSWTFAHLELKDLRRIADDMRIYWSFGSHLRAIVAARATGGRLDFGAAGSRVPTLPTKPALPTKIIKTSDGVRDYSP